MRRVVNISNMALLLLCGINFGFELKSIPSPPTLGFEPQSMSPEKHERCGAAI
jgi:hypothetical protein